MHISNWDILENLDVLTIVAAAPRPGTDFLHSLFDYHSQILTFDGWLLFHEFYYDSCSIYGTSRLIAGVSNDIQPTFSFEKIDAADFFYEFAWTHLHKFKSQYDNLELKDKLGIKKNESNIVDIDVFVNFAVELIKGKEFTSKNAMLATYGAYALARGEDLQNKKVLLHQVHWPEYISYLVQDFPDLKVIATARDPRIWGTVIKKYYEEIYLSKTAIGSASALFRASVDGLRGIEDFKQENIRINVLEKLHENPRQVLEAISLWLGIQFEDTLLTSTWNGKRWNGDSLSVDINSDFDVSRYETSQKKWRNDLFVVDMIVMECLMKDEIKSRGYVQEFTNSFWLILAPLLILIPTKYEVYFLISICKKMSFKLLPFLLRAIVSRYFFSYRKLLKAPSTIIHF